MHAIIPKKNISIEKQAMVPGLAGAVSHVGSNAMVRGVLKNKRLGREYGKHIARHTFDPRKRVGLSSLGLSSIAGVAPEFEMGMTAFNKKIIDFATDPKYKNSRRYLKILNNTSREKAMAAAVTPKGMLQAKNIQSRLTRELGGDGGSPVYQFVKGTPLAKMYASADPRLRAGAVDQIMGLKERSGIATSILPGIIDEVNDIQKRSGGNLPAAIQRKSSPRVAGASIAATALIDPVTAGWSGVKRFLGSSMGKKIKPVQKTQDWMSNKLVTERVKKLYDQGLSGKRGLTTGVMRPVVRSFDEYAMNPVTSEIKNLSYDFGKANYNAKKLMNSYRGNFRI